LKAVEIQRRLVSKEGKNRIVRETVRIGCSEPVFTATLTNIPAKPAPPVASSTASRHRTGAP